MTNCSSSSLCVAAITVSFSLFAAFFYTYISLNCVFLSFLPALPQPPPSQPLLLASCLCCRSLACSKPAGKKKKNVEDLPDGRPPALPSHVTRSESGLGFSVIVKHFGSNTGKRPPRPPPDGATLCPIQELLLLHVYVNKLEVVAGPAAASTERRHLKSNGDTRSLPPPTTF